MSFVTRCPACATHFRVVADQLKIADGWVRCGQCGEVFDAATQLLTPTDAAPMASDVAQSSGPLHPPEEAPADAVESVAPALDTPSVASFDGAPEAPAETPSDAALNDALDESARSLDAPPEPWPEPPPLADPTPVPGADGDAVPSAAPVEIDFSTDPVLRAVAAEAVADAPPLDPVDPVDRYEVPPAAELLPSPAEADPGPALADSADLAAVPEQVGFVRRAQRRAWWRRPAVRLVLSFMCLLLLLGLATQWVLHERDRIAALRPDWRPALERLCQPLGCTVQALRWVDALSIESTTLARRGNHRYLLEVVVRNASLYALALPALELSLTDVQDKLLLRRVIRPEELPAAPATVAAQESLTLRVEVQLDAAVSDGLSGYRTLLFYP